MNLNPIGRVLIVGGGTAGWMCAAAFARALQGQCHVQLVESDEIGAIGVGEASIPNLIEFNRALGIDEDEFLRETGGSFKLGIEFVNWGAIGERYLHGFGALGAGSAGLPFHQFWLRGAQSGLAGPLGDYAINTVAPAQARFLRARHDMSGSPLADLAHAFHFDASLYARYLRRYAETRGVTRTEGKVEQVLRRAEDGHIEAVLLAGGVRMDADFFIDCSGMRALLMAGALGVGFEDWSHWLPCDRALALPSKAGTPLLPMTRSTAHSAGWQWRIPLQHRTGNGHVYASAFMDDEEAERLLRLHLDSEARGDARPIRFRTGRLQRFWEGNCVAVGLSSGFLEPLESTSIHLIHMAVARILDFFPRAGFEAADVAEYNALTTREYERIRDFLVLHYKLTRREDSPFWRYCRHMAIPDGLRQKIELFTAHGRVIRHSDELFAEPSWIQVMVGQGLMPRSHHPFADQLPETELAAYLENVRQVIARCVQTMPLHADFIAQHCSRGVE